MLLLKGKWFDIAVPDKGAGCFAFGVGYHRDKTGRWLALILGPFLVSARVWPAKDSGPQGSAGRGGDEQAPRVESGR